MKFILGALILLSTSSVMADYFSCRWTEDKGDMIVSEDPNLNICIGSIECWDGSKNVIGKAVCKVSSKSKCMNAKECADQPGIQLMGVELGDEPAVYR